MIYIVVDSANLFAKKSLLPLKTKNIISGNIPFQQYKSNGNELANKCVDVKGIFEAKVRNEINDQRFALYKIALKGKDEVTTKNGKMILKNTYRRNDNLALPCRQTKKYYLLRL